MHTINKFFDVVFENENFLAINKSTNLSTEKNKFYKDSVESILESFGEPYSLLERCGIVHRIDRNTTGLLLIAKNNHYQAVLLNLFREKRIKKLYLSLNFGKSLAETGSIKMFLKKSFINGQKIKMVMGSPTDKFVELKFKRVSSSMNLSLFKIEALTGKTHQIRLAFESMKSPLYNDELYSTGAPSKFIFSSEGHYLHSYMLSFFDGTNEFKVFARLPSFFSDKIKQEGMNIKEDEISSLI